MIGPIFDGEGTNFALYPGNATRVELLPMHGFLHDQMLLDKGPKNYWGYNRLSFLAPHRAYLKSGSPAEVKSVVQKQHKAGIEVILVVVYNHRAEGSELGPTLSFRGSTLGSTSCWPKTSGIASTRRAAATR